MPHEPHFARHAQVATRLNRDSNHARGFVPLTQFSEMRFAELASHGTAYLVSSHAQASSPARISMRTRIPLVRLTCDSLDVQKPLVILFTIFMIAVICGADFTA